MKKLIIATMAIFMPSFVAAQTIQTKTEKVNDETTRTYSFYLNEKGEEVRHGKYTITWKVNRNEYKVNNKLDCNYKDGLLHGRLTYSCDWNVYKAYWSFTTKEDVVWKLEQKNLDNFTVDMYEGYMTGDINVTYQGWWLNETTFKAKAINGVLVDDSELIVVERPRGLVQEKLTYLDDAKETKRYKNILPASTPNPNLKEPSEFIAFEFPSDQYGGTEKYIINLPRYVDKPFDKLADIPEYNFLISYAGTDLSEIVYLEDQIRNSYYLSQPSKDTLNARYNLAKEQLAERKDMQKRQAQARKDVYVNACSKKENLEKQLKNKGFWLKSLQTYHTSDGYVVPVVAAENITGLLYGSYNKRVAELQDILASLNLSEYKNKEITDEDVLALNEYMQRLDAADIPNSIKKLSKLCEIENGIIGKMFSILTFYTKSSYSGGKIQAGSSKIPRFTNENCTTKCTNKKELYNAFVEVAAYLNQKSETCTLTEHLEIMTQFAQVVEVMYQGKNAKTKDTEKALKAATTPEEKLAIFLQ